VTDPVTGLVYMPGKKVEKAHWQDDEQLSWPAHDYLKVPSYQVETEEGFSYSGTYENNPSKWDQDPRGIKFFALGWGPTWAAQWVKTKIRANYRKNGTLIPGAWVRPYLWGNMWDATLYRLEVLLP
jgi:hypothetical protein